MTKHSKSTKANSLQAMTKDLLYKICTNNEMCKLLIINLVEGRQHKFKSISTSAYPQEEKDLRMEEEVNHTEKLISKTANYIIELHQKMEKELESMEVLGRVLDTAGMGIFKEIEKMRTEKLRGIMDIYVEMMATQPEMEQQLNLIIEYRHMLRNINKKHMEKQIKVELQNKILKQHKDRLSGFISRFKEEQERSLLLTEEDSQGGKTICSEIPSAGMGLTCRDRKVSLQGSTKVALSEDLKVYSKYMFDKTNIQPKMIEEARVIDPGLDQITNPAEYNILSNESFEKSKKDTLNLVILENEKFKGDKNRQGLRCSFKGCDFITSITKKCKARKKIKIHEEKLKL